MSYKCVVADDNIIERDLIISYIKKIAGIELKGEFQNAFDASAFLAENTIDIVFCDIDMPDLSGIGLLKSLRNPPLFIFTTSYKEFAIESYDLDVLDYIVKPVTFERLLKSVNKATEYLQLKKATKLNANSTDLQPQFTRDDHFFIKETQGITKLKYADVIYIESMGDFSKIYTHQPEPHIILSGLKNLEAQIPGAIFKRVHKQYIVNLSYISTITANDVLLINKRMVPLGSLFRQPLLEAFVNKEVIKRNFAG